MDIKKNIKNLYRFFKVKLSNRFSGLTSDEITNNIDYVSKIINVNTFYVNIKRNRTSALGIIFSKDRAMQLHALLGSYKDLVLNRGKLSIIYCASNEEHEKAYSETFQLFPELALDIIKQKSQSTFKALLGDLLRKVKEKQVFFLVDDNLFVESIDLLEFAAYSSTFCTPSMRMGYNLTYSYTMCKEQSKPTLITLNNEEVMDNNQIKNMPDDHLLCWSWDQGKLDWSYPLTVDGNIYVANEMWSIAQSIDFDSPNMFESRLQNFNHLYKARLGICFKKSRLLNIPSNRVQSDFDNLSGNVHQDWLLKQWQVGLCIDRKIIYGYKNISAHQEIPIVFCERK